MYVQNHTSKHPTQMVRDGKWNCSTNEGTFTFHSWKKIVRSSAFLHNKLSNQTEKADATRNFKHVCYISDDARNIPAYCTRTIQPHMHMAWENGKLKLKAFPHLKSISLIALIRSDERITLKSVKLARTLFPHMSSISFPIRECILMSPLLF